MTRNIDGKHFMNYIDKFFNAGFQMITPDGEIITKEEWNETAGQHITDYVGGEVFDVEDAYDPDYATFEYCGFVFPEKFWMYNSNEAGDGRYWYCSYFSHQVPAQWCRHIAHGFPKDSYELTRFRGDFGGKRTSKLMYELNDVLEKMGVEAA